MRRVYFALRADGAIKVGCSRNPRIRCRSLGYQLKTAVHLVAAFDGQFRHERALHRRFSHLRIEGEWFTPNRDLLALIAAVLAEDVPAFTWAELADADQLKAAA